MKPVDPKALRSDPIAKALRECDKDVIAVTGYVCESDDRIIAVSRTRDAPSCTEYRREAVVAAFEDEESGQVTLLVDADSRVRSVTTGHANQLRAIALNNNGEGADCKSVDGLASCVCKVGERCRSLTSTCICEDASRPLTAGDFANVAGLSSMGRLDPGMGGTAESAQAAAARLNYRCRTRRGECPIMCIPIYVGGKFVEWFCYCDCTNPIPDTMAPF